jgi:MoxR-like ATPase
VADQPGHSELVDERTELRKPRSVDIRAQTRAYEERHQRVDGDVETLEVVEVPRALVVGVPEEVEGVEVRIGFLRDVVSFVGCRDLVDHVVVPNVVAVAVAVQQHQTRERAPETIGKLQNCALLLLAEAGIEEVQRVARVNGGDVRDVDVVPHRLRAMALDEVETRAKLVNSCRQPRHLPPACAGVANSRAQIVRDSPTTGWVAVTGAPSDPRGAARHPLRLCQLADPTAVTVAETLVERRDRAPTSRARRVTSGRDTASRPSHPLMAILPREKTGRVTSAAGVAERLLDNVELVVHGKRKEIKLVLAALICEGHVLFEDVPGTAKTVLARSIAQSIDGAIPSRIQCTPDLQPTDVTGLSIYNQKLRDFEFRPGPIFANVVLVDEINRAMPKTQSALLEAMAERQVTVDGVTRLLPNPFLLLATENPIEHEGTFPLPEAQLDRFFVKTALGYPGADDELRIVRDQRDGHHPLGRLQSVVTVGDVEKLQDAVADVYIDELIQRWIIGLVRATRDLDLVAIGASVRGSLALERIARAWALLDRRDYVVPEDVETLFVPVLSHRVIFRPSFVAETRRIGWAAAMAIFRERCLELAPRPEANSPRAEGGSRAM